MHLFHGSRVVDDPTDRRTGGMSTKAGLSLGGEQCMPQVVEVPIYGDSSSLLVRLNLKAFAKDLIERRSCVRMPGASVRVHFRQRPETDW